MSPLLAAVVGLSSKPTQPSQERTVLVLDTSSPCRSRRLSMSRWSPHCWLILGRSDHRMSPAVVKAQRQVVLRHRPLEVRLVASFRSVPPLIGWLNARFARSSPPPTPSGAPPSALA